MHARTSRNQYAPHFFKVGGLKIIHPVFLCVLHGIIFPIFSSSEPTNSQGELIVYPCSGVRRCRRCRPQQCLKIFSSETAWPIKAKFYAEPPLEGGTKVYINGSDHMIKMATPRPYMLKSFKNILLQNQNSCDHETWHATSGTHALQS